MNLPLYLDYNATTPVDPEVADAVDACLREHFGNPSSSHRFGRQAHDAVNRARGQIAALTGADPREIVFTGVSGAEYAVKPRQERRMSDKKDRHRQLHIELTPKVFREKSPSPPEGGCD